MVSPENITLLQNAKTAETNRVDALFPADKKNWTELDYRSHKRQLAEGLTRVEKQVKETHTWFLNEKYPLSDSDDGVYRVGKGRTDVKVLYINSPYGNRPEYTTNGDLDLSEFTGLTKLVIGGGVNRLDISKCVALEELAINGYNNLADKTLAFLKPLTNLKKLNLGVFNHYTGFTGYAVGSDVNTYETNNLERGGFTGSLADFADLKDLEELCISGNRGIERTNKKEKYNRLLKKGETKPDGSLVATDTELVGFEREVPDLTGLAIKTKLEDGNFDPAVKGLTFEKFLFDNTRFDNFEMFHMDKKTAENPEGERTLLLKYDAITPEQFYKK